MERVKAATPSGSAKDIMSGEGRGSPVQDQRNDAKSANGYDGAGHPEDGEDFGSDVQEQSENGDALRMVCITTMALCILTHV